MKTTVGDLIAALSKYDSNTPIIGVTMEGSTSSVFSIQEAHEVDGDEDKIVSVSIHSWPTRQVEDGTIMGLVTPSKIGLPRIIPMASIPANENPFRHDAYHMGCEVSGPWMAMFEEFAGHKQDHNKTPEELESGKAVWNPDPKYIIMINQRTGQRFRMIWDQVPKDDKCEFMQELLARRERGEELI